MTNKNKLTVILLVAVLVVVGLIISGVVNLQGWPGRTSEGALVDARINATEVVQAERAEVARRQEVAATAQAKYDIELTAVAVTGTATANDATATLVRATKVAADNATNTARPPTETAQAQEATATAEREAIDWMKTQESDDANATATQEIRDANATATHEAKDRAENREDAKVTQGWWILVGVLALLGSWVICIVLILRIWFKYIVPLRGLQKQMIRLAGLANTVPSLHRKVQEIEERIEHAKNQE